MKKRIKWNPRFMTSLFIAFMCTLSCFAQNVIKGSVSDGGGEPLPGVSVAVKGTTSGTITDMDGKFSINARNNDVLIFSYVGMNTQDIKVNGQHFISVTMKDDVASLDEVVVVGYGTQKRGSITGAISTVSDKELLKAPTMSISNVVGARIAGVAAVQSSGQPGSDNATLTMRGQSGIVYVIDGIRRTSADFNGLDPNEIESVSILKDASAVAVYGLDANGVFIVTTKQGKAEKMSITYTGSVGFSQNAEQQEWLDGPDGSRVADRSVGNSPCFGAEHPDSQWHATFQSRRQADPDRNGENRMHAGSGHAGRRLPAPWRIQYGFYPGRVETV